MRIVLLLLLTILTSCQQNIEVSDTNENKDIIRKFFNEVIENLHVEKIRYNKFFADDFIFRTEGKNYNLEEFKEILKKDKNNLKSIKLSFIYLIAEENKVSTQHKVYAIKKDGKALNGQISMVFQIEDGKLVLLDEIAQLENKN